MVGKEWTVAEDRLLEEMWSAGFNARQISEKIGCGRQAVYKRVRLLTERRYKDEVSRGNCRDSGGAECAVGVGGSED
jgi:hypothetical protein